MSNVVEDAIEKVDKRLNHLEPSIYKNSKSLSTRTNFMLKNLINFNLDAMQKPGSVGWFMSASYKSSELAKNFSRLALIAEDATKTLVKR